MSFNEGDILLAKEDSYGVDARLDFIKGKLYKVVVTQGGALRVKPLVGNHWPSGSRVRSGKYITPDIFKKL